MRLLKTRAKRPVRWNSVRRSLCTGLLVTGASLAGFSNSSDAQVTLGFDRVAEARALNTEVVRQPDLWMMECQIKPVRMIWVDKKDPETGEIQKEEVWYLAWRAIRRPLSGRTEEDADPVNDLDPLPGPRKFVPQFTLITYDNPNSEIPTQILPDEIIPEALKKIQKIERKGTYLNSVDVVQDVPDPTAADAETQKWIWGVATWRGVDPDTDFFKILINGCTNGYEVRTAADGSRQVWRKVVELKFYRPGDRFDPNLKEFQYASEARWVMQPDSGNPTSSDVTLGQIQP